MKHINQFEDMMGIVIETDNAWLDKKLNGHICYKGGGTTQTAQSSIPDFLKPYVEDFVKKGSLAEGAGALSQVAGFTGDQQAAVDTARRAATAQEGLAGQSATAHQGALTGTGLFGAQDLTGQKDAYLQQARSALGENLAGQAASSSQRGVLGSLRSQAAREKAREQTAGNVAGQFAQLDAQDLNTRRQAQQGAVGQTAGVQGTQGAAAQTLQASGAAQQSQQQKEADATYQGLQRLGGLFGVASGTAKDVTKTGDSGGK